MMPSIEISADLYVALKTLMHPEDRTPSDVIWRLVEKQQVIRTEPTSRERLLADQAERRSTFGEHHHP